MINFYVGPLHTLRYLLWTEEQQANMHLMAITRLGNTGVQPWPREADAKRISTILDPLLVMIEVLKLEATKNRIERMKYGLSMPCTANYIESELRMLRETMDDDFREVRLYHYPKDKVSELLTFKEDWSATIRAFPSAKDDAHDAIDCYAMDKNTACVFHLMRVLEHGIRALASDVGRIFDSQNWHNIIEEIEKAIEAERKTPKSPSKTERLTFLSAAAKEFFYFKDGWRNHVSHNRSSYDQHQARSTIEHVRSFMTHLSTRLSE